MKELIIVGAGGFGREVYTWATQCPEYNKEWTIKGFLDDNSNALLDYSYPVPVIGRVSDYQPKPSDCFVFGIGTVAVKKKVCIALKERGAKFIQLIHPSAVVGLNVDIGEGTVICPNVTVTSDIKIGQFVLINCNTCIGHDAELGDWSTISAHCDITGFSKLGREVFLGSHVSIIPGRKIGDASILGAGSVVIQHVKPGKTVFGVPAKKLM